MDLYKKIDLIYQNEENDFLRENDRNGAKIAALYSLYHYYNDDLTKLNDVNASICQVNYRNSTLSAINLSCTMETEAIDFLFYLDSTRFEYLFAGFEKYLKECAEVVANIIVQNVTIFNANAIDVYNALNVQLPDSTSFVVRILCDFNLPVQDKYSVQQFVTEYSVKSNNISFEILFADDIEDEINDVESPKEYVSKGFFEIFNPTSVCYFGNEKSFITMVSAKSLKNNFIQHGTHGLLASNLRFFVNSKKIDPKIINSIKNDSENFCYYNNGIIITCEDYKITGNVLQVFNFSIVNGGQTTNLVGRTPFEKDFGIVCKVIRNKYENTEDKIEFLSKVAEASNTQKPINAKDLIANKPEQRKLKIQFAEAGMFLKVKRGEKIDASLYKEKWQNASNDEIAQILYSTVYQCPGASKNSKSKLLDTERIYNKLFKSDYCNNFFVSLQHLKIAINDYQKKVAKTEYKTSVKYGLVKHANFFLFASIGFLYKILTNDELYGFIADENYYDLNNSNDLLKKALQQNDIGDLNLLKTSGLEIISKTSYFKIFDYIMETVLIDSYKTFKKEYVTYAYSNFCKSDMYYYNYVIPLLWELVEEKYDEIREKMKPFFDFSKDAKSLNLDDDEILMEVNNTSLVEELRAYRTKKYHESNDKIPAYKIFTDRQLSNLVKNLPKTLDALEIKAKFSDYQLENFGDDIVEIIKKHTNIDLLI